MLGGHGPEYDAVRAEVGAVMPSFQATKKSAKEHAAFILGQDFDDPHAFLKEGLKKLSQSEEIPHQAVDAGDFVLFRDEAGTCLLRKVALWYPDGTGEIYTDDSE